MSTFTIEFGFVLSVYVYCIEMMVAGEVIKELSFLYCFHVTAVNRSGTQVKQIYKKRGGHALSQRQKGGEGGARLVSENVVPKWLVSELFFFFCILT